MVDQPPEIRCGACDAPMAPDDPACPACGNTTRRFLKDVQGAVGLEAGLKLAGRHGEPGEVKPYLRKTIKQEYARDRERPEDVERTFDRDAGTYDEVYTDPDTGEVVFEKHGQIDDQSIHGPRGKQPPPDEA